MRRYGLRNDQWGKIELLLPSKKSDVGVTAKDNRLFVEAALGNPIEIHLTPGQAHYLVGADA